MARLGCAVLLVVLAVATTVTAFSGPGQAEEDAMHWALLAGGGVSARPFVSDLAVTNAAGVTYTAWTGLTTAASSPPSELATSTGRLTAVVYATNMCSAGQTSGCYASPNRVAIDVGVSSGSPVNYNFEALNCTDQLITAASVIDMKVALNSFAGRVSWTFANGHLTWWALSSTHLHIKFRPALAPVIDWTAYPNTGCTATPIRDCDVASTAGSTLSAYLFFSVDQTLSSLGGAVFATSGAIIGYLNPIFANSAINPALNYQLSSAHLTPSGALQTGSLRAVLPRAVVSTLFPSFASYDNPAAYFAVARVGAGTQDSITWSNWTAAEHGSDGIAFDVTGVTFSAPTYLLTGNAASSVRGMPAHALLAALFVVAAIAAAL